MMSEIERKWDVWEKKKLGSHKCEEFYERK
jgi:hypothetical protein